MNTENIIPTGLEREAELVYLFLVPTHAPTTAREFTIAISVLSVKAEVIPRLPACNTENTKV